MSRGEHPSINPTENPFEEPKNRKGPEKTGELVGMILGPEAQRAYEEGPRHRERQAGHGRVVGIEALLSEQQRLTLRERNELQDQVDEYLTGIRDRIKTPQDKLLHGDYYIQALVTLRRIAEAKAFARSEQELRSSVPFWQLHTGDIDGARKSFAEISDQLDDGQRDTLAGELAYHEYQEGNEAEAWQQIQRIVDPGQRVAATLELAQQATTQGRNADFFLAEAQKGIPEVDEDERANAIKETAAALIAEGRSTDADRLLRSHHMQKPDTYRRITIDLIYAHFYDKAQEVVDTRLSQLSDKNLFNSMSERLVEALTASNESARAEQIASKITDPVLQKNAQFWLALADLQQGKDDKTAEDLIGQLEQQLGPQEQLRYRLALAQARAQAQAHTSTDRYDQALATLERIQDNVQRSRGQKSVAVMMALHGQQDRARELAHRIGDPATYAAIIEVLAKRIANVSP